MMILEQEVVALKARVERLEAVVRRLVGPEHTGAAPVPGEPLDHARRLAQIQADEVIVAPPPVAQEDAERWRTLPEAEQQHIRRELHHLPPGPLVSDMVSENRRYPGFLSATGEKSGKSEIRSTNLEANPKSKCSKVETHCSTEAPAR